LVGSLHMETFKDLGVELPKQLNGLQNQRI